MSNPKCNELRAYAVSHADWPTIHCVVWSTSRSKAQWALADTLIDTWQYSARDALKGISCRRAPMFDSWRQGYPANQLIDREFAEQRAPDHDKTEGAECTEQSS